MQKWCPDAFSTEETSPSGKVAIAESFESDSVPVRAEDGSPATRFRSESRFTDPRTLLGHLTRKERAQLFELVEQDVAAEYHAREEELRKESQAEVQAQEKIHQDSLASLAAELDAAMAVQIQDIAAATARLAVQLAEKIVRRSVTLDHASLTKVLEVTQYKLMESVPLTVNLNPEDADWLQNQPEMLKELKIAQVHADRRIDRGGCVIKAGAQEWDATISRQLESLAEIVEDNIGAAGTISSILKPEDTDESPLG